LRGLGAPRFNEKEENAEAKALNRGAHILNVKVGLEKDLQLTESALRYEYTPETRDLEREAYHVEMESQERERILKEKEKAEAKEAEGRKTDYQKHGKFYKSHGQNEESFFQSFKNMFSR